MWCHHLGCVSANRDKHGHELGSGCRERAPGYQPRPARPDGKQGCFIAHDQYSAVDRGDLYRYDTGGSGFHPDFSTCLNRRGNSPPAFRHHHDHEPVYRPLHAARRDLSVPRVRHCQYHGNKNNPENTAFFYRNDRNPDHLQLHPGTVSLVAGCIGTIEVIWVMKNNSPRKRITGWWMCSI